MLTLELHEQPFSQEFVAELATLAAAIFGEVDADDLGWRLARMPDATVHVMRSEGHLVASKFGYAMARALSQLAWRSGSRAPTPRHRPFLDAAATRMGPQSRL